MVDDCSCAVQLRGGRHFSSRQALGFVSIPVCDNAVVELYGRLPSAKFSHFEATVGFAGDKETFAIPLRCEKHVIAQGQINGLGEPRVQRNGGGATA